MTINRVEKKLGGRSFRNSYAYPPKIQKQKGLSPMAKNSLKKFAVIREESYTMVKKISEETKTTKTEKENGTMIRRNNSAYRSMGTITMMIRNQGATTDDISEKYGIRESTLRRYLHKYFVRSDTIKHYNRLLRENAKAKQARAVAEVVESVRTNEVVEETAEATKLIEPAKTTKFFIIDPILVLVHENRKSFGKVIEKLSSEHLDFVIYSNSRLKYMKKNCSRAAAMLAEEILENDKIEKAETVLALNEYSAFMEGIIITDFKAKIDGSLENAYEVITFKEFLDGASENKRVDEKEMNSIDYVRKLTVPVTLNKMGRMICDLGKLQEYLENVYGANSIVDVKIIAEDGKERKTPTGKLMIKIGDTIRIKAVGDGGFTAKLSIIKNETVNNAVESYYNADNDESASADNHDGGVEIEFAM